MLPGDLTSKNSSRNNSDFTKQVGQVSNQNFTKKVWESWDKNHLYYYTEKLPNRIFHTKTGWWLNQPIWNIFVKLEIVPQFSGKKMKNLS